VSMIRIATGLTAWFLASVVPAARLAAQQPVAQQPAAQQPAAQAPAAAVKRNVPAALLAKAKITEDSARALALAQVPHASVKEVELEEEHGALVWSFDLAVAGKPGIEEVNVDALTGKIVSVEHEAH
jgi:uncharacterized membrane protein YkoI